MSLLAGVGLTAMTLGYVLGRWRTRKLMAKAMFAKDAHEAKRWAMLQTAPRSERRRVLREQWGDSGLRHG